MMDMDNESPQRMTMSMTRSVKTTMLHMPQRSIFRALIYLASLFLLLFCVQAVFVPNQVYPVNIEDPSAMFREYKQLPEDSVDVLFLGTSHVQYGINPMEIYREQQIVSYNLSTSGQKLATSYYMLEEAVKTQHPKAVLLDASSIYLTTYWETELRVPLDGFFTGKTKLKAAQHYAVLKAENDPTSGQAAWFTRSRAFLSAYDSLYRFHDRWDELRRQDFEDYKMTNYWMKGYVFFGGTLPGSCTVEEMNAAAQWMSEQTTLVTTETDADGVTVTDEEPATLYSATPGEAELDWLWKLRELCDENGAELIVFKTPVIIKPRNYDSAWTKLKSDTIREILAEKNIRFVDCLYDAELGYDTATDFIDGGKHCNFLGALKTSDYMADYLADTVQISPQEHPQYESCLARYEAVRSAGVLETTTDANTYLTLLEDETEDRLVLIAEKNEESDGQSGLTIIDEGTAVYTAVSDRKLTKEYSPCEGVSITLESAGSRDSAEGDILARITINGAQYSLDQTGRNIVVYDKKARAVLDSVAISDNSGSNGSAMILSRADAKNYLLPYIYALPGK